MLPLSSSKRHRHKTHKTPNTPNTPNSSFLIPTVDLESAMSSYFHKTSGILCRLLVLPQWSSAKQNNEQTRWFQRWIQFLDTLIQLGHHDLRQTERRSSHRSEHNASNTINALSEWHLRGRLVDRSVCVGLTGKGNRPKRTRKHALLRPPNVDSSKTLINTL